MINLTRHVPNQALNFAFKDSMKRLFPIYDSKKEFGKFALVQFASGALAGIPSLCVVYPLDYARFRLSSDTLERVNSRDSPIVLPRHVLDQRVYLASIMDSEFVLLV